MLDNYVNTQKVAYTIMKNAILKNKISHAYLIDTNGNEDGIEMAKSFAKAILCPYSYTSFEKCKECSQCKNIDKNIFVELKIIEPDGLWIRKEQLDELQKEFSYKSIVGTKKVYIINGAEFLNTSSANTILKFLEEPAPNIFAILITKNSYQVMETILSRCQMISLNKIEKYNLDNLNNTISQFIKIPNEITDEQFTCLIDCIKSFVLSVETKKYDTLLYTQKLWHELINSKELNLLSFQILILYYKDVLNYLVKGNINIFINDQNILKIAEINDFETLQSKIKKILYLQEQIKFNANTNLLIDRLIMDLIGG